MKRSSMRHFNKLITELTRKLSISCDACRILINKQSIWNPCQLCFYGKSTWKLDTNIISWAAILNRVWTRAKSNLNRKRRLNSRICWNGLEIGAQIYSSPDSRIFSKYFSFALVGKISLITWCVFSGEVSCQKLHSQSKS